MSDRRLKILQVLVTEYSRSGHEVTEHKGEQFARITNRNGDAIEMTDICLTRIAREIDRRMERLAI